MVSDGGRGDLVRGVLRGVPFNGRGMRPGVRDYAMIKGHVPCRPARSGIVQFLALRRGDPSLRQAGGKSIRMICGFHDNRCAHLGRGLSDIGSSMFGLLRLPARQRAHCVFSLVLLTAIRALHGVRE